MMRKEGKFNPTAERCVFLGYAFHLGHKCFLLGSLVKRYFYVSTNVNFAEGVFPYRKHQTRQLAEEYWGEELTGKDATPIPCGPSIIAWDNDSNDKPSNVEIILDEQDQVDKSLAEATNIVSKTVTSEQATTVRT